MHRRALLLLLFALSLPAYAGEGDDLEQAAEQQVARGNDLLSTGDYEGARRSFERANALMPEASGPYAGLGFALKGLGRCGEALPNFQAYLARSPKGPSAHEVEVAIVACKKA